MKNRRMIGGNQAPDMTLTLSNLAKFMAFMSPFLIVFSMIIYSIFSNNLVKGLMFSAGLMIITFVNYILKHTLKSPQDVLASPYCNIIPTPFTVKKDTVIFNSPSLNATVIGYASGMLIFPMYMNNDSNPALLTFLIAIIMINAVVEYQSKCTNIAGIVLGSIVGILFGILFYSLLKMTGNDDLAYFAKLSSNNSQCSKPGKQKFRCTGKRRNPDGTYREWKIKDTVLGDEMIGTQTQLFSAIEKAKAKANLLEGTQTQQGRRQADANEDVVAQAVIESPLGRFASD